MEINLKLNSWQGKFFLSQAKHLAYYGEFRSGKTTIAALRVIKSLAEYPGTWFAIIRNIYSDLIKSTIPQFKRLYDWDITEETFNKSNNILYMQNGSVILFMALDRPDDTKKLKNIELGGFWFDQAEEIHPDIWDMAEGRVAQNCAEGLRIATGNPEGKTWDYYKFFCHPVETITGTWRDKILEKGVYRGENEDHIGFLPPPFLNEANLPKGDYDDLIKTHSSDWVDKYVYGIFTGSGGTVHRDYDEKRHLIRASEYFEIPYYWEHYEGMDYGVSNPTCWLFVRYDRQNDVIYFLDEYYVASHGIAYHAPNVKILRSEYGMPLLTVGCPAAFATERDGRTPAQEYSQKYGINLIPYPAGFEPRVEIVNRRLKQNRIVIFDRCRNLVKQIEGTTWKNIDKIEDHALEAFHRIVAKIDAISGRENYQQLEQRLEQNIKNRPITASIMKEAF